MRRLNVASYCGDRQFRLAAPVPRHGLGSGTAAAAFGIEVQNAGHVRGADVELGTVPVRTGVRRPPSATGRRCSVAVKRWCARRLPGAASIWPGRTWCRLTPRSSSAALRNLSTCSMRARPRARAGTAVTRQCPMSRAERASRLRAPGTARTARPCARAATPLGPFPDLAPVDLDAVPAGPAGEEAGEVVPAHAVKGLPAGAADRVHGALLGEHAQVPLHRRQAGLAAVAVQGGVDVPGAAVAGQHGQDRDDSRGLPGGADLRPAPAPSGLLRSWRFPGISGPHGRHWARPGPCGPALCGWPLAPC